MYFRCLPSCLLVLQLYSPHSRLLPSCSNGSSLYLLQPGSSLCHSYTPFILLPFSAFSLLYLDTISCYGIWVPCISPWFHSNLCHSLYLDSSLCFHVSTFFLTCLLPAYLHAWVEHTYTLTYSLFLLLLHNSYCSLLVFIHSNLWILCHSWPVLPYSHLSCLPCYTIFLLLSISLVLGTTSIPTIWFLSHYHTLPFPLKPTVTATFLYAISALLHAFLLSCIPPCLSPLPYFSMPRLPFLLCLCVLFRFITSPTIALHMNNNSEHGIT